MKLTTNVNGYKLVTDKIASGATVTTVYYAGEIKYVTCSAQDAFDYADRRKKND